MLSPKKLRWRRQHRDFGGKGYATRGNFIAFGDVGLKTVQQGRISNRQIEAGRMAIQRHLKRAGKVWIRIFPDRPYTAKPAETRMGKGKGSPTGYIAPVRPGRVMYEIGGVNVNRAKEALALAAQKMPVKTKIEEKG